MRHKRLKLSAILLLGLGLTSIQAQTLYVKAKTGTQTPYSLNDIKKITFSSGNLSVNKKAGGADSYALTNLRYLSFNSTTEVEEMTSSDSRFIVYPNPANTELNLQLNGMKNEAVTIKILSINGRVVYNEELRKSVTNQTINISGLPEGLYLCIITSGTNRETTKFIKQ